MPVLVFCTQGCPSNVKVGNVKEAFVETWTYISYSKSSKHAGSIKNFYVSLISKEQ